MKLDDLYNFYDGILPPRHISQHLSSQSDYTASIALMAEKQFTKNLKQTRRNLCYMVYSGNYSHGTITRTQHDILKARNNAVKARELKNTYL